MNAASDEHVAPARRLVIRQALVLLPICLAVVAARGFGIAHLVRGRYQLSDLAVETLGLCGLVLVLRLFDAGLNLVLERAVRPERAATRTAARVVRVAILAIVAGPFLLAFLQLHPQRIVSRGTPAELGLHYEDVVLDSEGLRLQSWFIEGRDSSAPVVLVAHGLGANRGNMLFTARILRSLGFGTLLVGLRAHGLSEGRTVTFGAREAVDVKAGYDWIRARFPQRAVYAIGYSMGGAAVLRAARDHGIFDRVVLDSTFASAEGVARATILRFLGPLQGPVWQVGRFWARLLSGVDLGALRLDEAIAEVVGRCPVLLIHGTGDTVIPSAQSERLHEASGGRALLWLVPGLGHIEALGLDEYEDRLREFFR